MNPLKALTEFGQSVYLDEIRRSMLTNGYLQTLIERDGLRGVTSNPAIFQKAIAESGDYDEALAQMRGRPVADVYEELVIHDIGAAADLFREMYEASDGEHGFVSIEVSPALARDTEGTLEEARRLWQRLARPNVFIKIPGTAEGLPAIQACLEEGVNINVTLLFSLERYRAVAEAYVAALEARLERGEDVRGVASVASFFLSRIDVLADKLLAEKGEAGRALKGKIGVASAKRAYAIYQEVFGSPRFARLKALGARPQRLLWASTGTKNPAYSDVMYVEPLIGPDTVTTLPTETLDAYRDHGQPAARLTDGQDEAAAQLAALESLGVSLDSVTEQLEAEGIDKFVQPFESLMATLAAAVGSEEERLRDSKSAH
jgi:transaldolase